MWRVLQFVSRQRLLVMYDSFQVFVLFWLYYHSSEPYTFCCLRRRLCKNLSIRSCVQCSVWWTLSELGREQSGSLQQLWCGLGGGIAYSVCRGSWAGGRGGRSSLLLLSAASFVTAWAAHFPCQYFLISRSCNDSGVTDGSSRQYGFLLHQKTGTEGKGEDISEFCC